MSAEPLKIYYIPELAEVLGLHKRTVLDYCEKGKIKARKVGRRWAVSADNLRDFINTATNTAADGARA